MSARTILQSFGYAFAGVVYVLKTQRNARIHAAVAAGVVLVGAFLPLEIVEWAIIALTIGAVFSAEMGNTVVESVVDLASPEYHALAKVAKDVAAGAVLCLALAAVIVGLLILGPALVQAIG